MLKVVAAFDQTTVVGELPLATEQQAEAVLASASRAFQDRSRWLLKHERIAILRRVAELVRRRAAKLVGLAASEGGKPFADSEHEVRRGIEGIESAIATLQTSGGREIPMGLTPATEGHVAMTFREPVGVVFAISAFNHPFNLIIHQAVTAFAVGCPVIVKPALTTPLSCEALVEILYEAGVPREWCQMIVCENAIAERVAADSRVAFLSFIGSSRVGWRLRSRLAPGSRCALEHGGAAPVIMLEDADLTAALVRLAKGGFYHAGQVCVSVQRVFALKGVAKKVAKGLAELAERLVVGDPLDSNTDVGPMILPSEVSRVAAWVDEAVEKGARLLCGGRRLSETTYAPTVLLDPPSDVRVSTDEVFGPVVCVYTCGDLDEAIERANGLAFSFQSAVFGQALGPIIECVQRLQATSVMVNEHTAFRADWMPFGGDQLSGTGVGGIPYSMADLTREKLVVVKTSP